MRKERGAITIITLVTILFMISFLISTFVIIANRRQAQTEIKRETQDIYESDVDNKEQIYNSYFASSDETIPISTPEQLLKIATDGYIVSDGKIYKCLKAADYQLVNDIELKNSDYLLEYPAAFEEVTYMGTETTTQTVTNQITDFSYTGAVQTYTAPATGTYTLQVWGAQGGYYNATYGTGGLGGYSIGTINLQQGDILYVYVGQQGGYTTAKGNSVVTNGYNGGGGASYYGGTGGGATDVRTVGGTWNDGASLLSRIIVAGGGRRCTRKR